jgi:hypothetical protein
MATATGLGYVGHKQELPIGHDGMYGPRRVPVGGLILARGVTFENNQLEKEGGAQRQTLSSLPGPLVGLYDWWPEAATQRTVAITTGGGVYVDDGVSWTFAITAAPEGTLATTTQRPYFVAGGQETPGAPRKLFVYTGASPIFVGEGDFTTLRVLPSAKRPADWVGARQPSCGIIHEGRHWAFLGHTAYYTPSADHEDFVGTGAGSIPIAPGEGEAIVAAVSFRKMLVLFKRPRGIYVVDTSGDPLVWRYDVQSRAVGAPGPWAVTPIPNDVAFVGSEGAIHLLSATAVERDAESSDISTIKLGTWIREHIDPEALSRAILAWYGDKRLAYALFPGRGQATQLVSAFQDDAFDLDTFQITDASSTVGVPIYRLLIDFNNPSVGPRFAYSDRDDAQVLMMRRHQGIERPYIGTSAGSVYRLDHPDRVKDGEGFIGEFQTDHLDLGDLVAEWRGQAKNFDYLEFWLEGVGPYTLSVDIYIDGAKKTLTPLTFDLSGAGVPLGQFRLDVDRLAESTIVTRRRRLMWRGRRISIRGWNSGANQTFKIIRAFIGARAAE